MSNTVVLDNVEHHDLRIRAERGSLFGDDINQALVFPNEFRDLQREYTILLRKDANNNFYSVALLGLDRDENLYLDGNIWNAKYMPASQARGPFSIAMQKPADGSGQAEPKVKVDLEHAAVNKEEGFPLFKQQGGYAPYLEHILNVLRTVHDGVAQSSAFFSMLEKYALLEQITLEISVGEAMQYSIPDVFSINQDVFGKLSGDALKELHDNGTLAACHWVLASLDNVRRLADMKSKAKA